MTRIPYPDLDRIDDPTVHAILDRARTEGVPRPESQAIRAHVPAILTAFTAAWRAAIDDHNLDHAIKELCRLYIAKSVDCEYCGGQRSAAFGQSLVEGQVDEILRFRTSERFDDRQRTALAYAEAIAWDPNLADDAMWERLRAHFDDRQLVELGFFIALTLGQQRWIKTLDLHHREVLGDTSAGLAASV